MCGDLFALRNWRCKFSVNSVFQTFHCFSLSHHPSLFPFQCLKHLCMDIYGGDLFALVKSAKKSAKIGSHIYA